MIPVLDNSVKIIDTVIAPSKSYKWDFYTKRVGGSIDNLDAIVQAAIKVLSTLRYSSPIHSGNYGHEITQLIGQDIQYVIVEVKRVIKDALITDDRINGVHSFVITQLDDNSLDVQFDLQTVEGVVIINTGVTI